MNDNEFNLDEVGKDIEKEQKKISEKREETPIGETIKKLKKKQKGYIQTIDDDNRGDTNSGGRKMKSSKLMMVGGIVFILFLTVAVSWAIVGLFGASKSDITIMHNELTTSLTDVAHIDDLSNFVTEEWVNNKIPNPVDTSSFVTKTITDALDTRLLIVEGAETDYIGLSLIVGQCCNVSISGDIIASIAHDNGVVYVIPVNSSVTLNATALTGQSFSGWDINGNIKTNNSITIVANTSMNIKTLCPASNLSINMSAVWANISDIRATLVFYNNRLATLEVFNISSINGRLVTIESLNISNYITDSNVRLTLLEGVNSSTRLTALESLNISARLASLEANDSATVTSIPSYCLTDKPNAVTPTAGQSNVISGTINFEWTVCNYSDHYEFWIGTDPSSMILQTNVSAPAHFYLFPAPTPDVYYYWKIVAVGACNNTRADAWWFKTAP